MTRSLLTEMESTNLRARLEVAWCAETSVDPGMWAPTYASQGQCLVTALLLQRILGGELLGGTINGISHYWNRLSMPGGEFLEVDLTRDQFTVEGLTPRDVKVVERHHLMADPDVERRYALLAYRYEKVPAESEKEEVEMEVAQLQSSGVEWDTILDGPRAAQKDCWQVAEDHGWHEGVDDRLFVEKLALIHSETSEALEEYRNGHDFTHVYYREADGKPEGIPVELADILIRLLDLAEIYGIDLADAVKEKQEFNRTRPYRHGNKRA